MKMCMVNKCIFIVRQKKVDDEAICINDFELFQQFTNNKVEETSKT